MTHGIALCLALALAPVCPFEDAVQFSEKGLEWLAGLEGFRSEMYCDEAGHCTVGYGHLVHRGPLGSNPRAEEPFVGRTLTKTQGRNLLRLDVQKAETAINSFVTVPLTQSQFDALVSFVFNIGADAFEESTLLRLLNDRFYDAVPHEIVRWHYVHRDGERVSSAGLMKRRLAEIAHWKKKVA